MKKKIKIDEQRSLNDRRLYDRRLKAATCCRHSPSPARPKAVVNSILTSIIPTCGQNLAYISDELSGYLFWLERRVRSASMITAEKV